MEIFDLIKIEELNHGLSPLEVENKILDISRKVLISYEVAKNEFMRSKDSFIKKIQKKIRKYREILHLAQNVYEKAIQNYYLNNRDNKYLISAHISSEIEITPSILMKLIRKSLLILSQKNIDQTTEFTFWKWKEGWHFFIKKEENDLILLRWSGKKILQKADRLYLINSNKPLVQKIYDMTQANIKVLKILNEASLNENTLISSEAQKLQKIHAEKNIKGIQPPPYGFIIYQEEDFWCASINKYFQEKDVFQAIEKKIFEKMTKIELLMIFKELLGALIYLHTEGGMIHGDLKPENIFCEKDEFNQFHAVIGDLEGAKYIEDELNLQNKENIITPPFGTYISHYYYTLSDYLYLKKFFDLEKQKEWIKYQKKRDLFALIKIFWTMVTGFDLEYTEIQGLPEVKKPVANYKIVEKRCGIKVAKIFSKTLIKMPDERPSKKKILNILENEIIGVL